MAEKSEKWTQWLALSTALMAVIAALTTMYMGKYSSRAVLYQGQESDTWAYYQAKSIKAHNYEMQKDTLELQLMLNGGRASGGILDKVRASLGRCDLQIAKYDKEKKELKAQAEALAAKKLLAQEMGGDLGYSLIFVQISIMLSSVASLSKKKYLWYIGLGLLSGWFFFVLDTVFRFY